MHPAAAFHEADRAQLVTRANARGLALIITVEGGRPRLAHAPILLDAQRLRFHLSAANPLARGIDPSGRALAVVTATDAYVSPDWYGLDDQVPTWNYLSVEIEGPTRRLDRQGLLAILDDLSARHEATLAPKPPWTRAKLTPGRLEAMLAGVVGFEMAVERLEGITKLSQNKPAQAMAAAANRLAERPGEGEREIASAMRMDLANR